MKKFEFESSSFNVLLQLFENQNVYKCRWSAATPHGEQYGESEPANTDRNAINNAVNDIMKWTQTLTKQPKKVDIAAFNKWFAAEVMPPIVTHADALFQIAASQEKELIAMEAIAENTDSEIQHEIINLETKSMLESHQSKEQRERKLLDVGVILGGIRRSHSFEVLATVSGLLDLKYIIDNKLYRDIPSISTLDKLCESVGYSYRTIKERLDNLNALGEELYETVSDFGYRELRILRNAAKDGSISITDQFVIVESPVESESTPAVKEEIPYNSKDELKEVLSELIEAKNLENKRLKHELEAKELLNKTHSKTIEHLARDNDRLEQEIGVYTNVKSIKGMPVADYPFYEQLATCNKQLYDIFHELCQHVGNIEQLSAVNQAYLGGTIITFGSLYEQLREKAGVRGHVMERFFNGDPLAIAGIEPLEGHRL